MVGAIGGSMNANQRYADKGHHYCFVLTANGWRNQGMVPDNNRQPFIEEYKQTKGTQVAFVPFCWSDDPNVMTDSHIKEFSNQGKDLARYILNEWDKSKSWNVTTLLEMARMVINS